MHIVNLRSINQFRFLVFIGLFFVLGKTQIATASTPFAIPSVKTMDAGIDSFGNILVAAQTTSNNIEAYSYSKSTGTWSGPVSITSKGTSVNPPIVTVARNGNALLVWLEGSGSTFDLYGSYYEKSWNAGANTIIASAISKTAAKTGFDSLGNAIVVWAANGSSIGSAFYTKGIGWQKDPPTVPFSGTLSNVGLAVSGAGDASALWESSSDIYSTVYSGSLKQWSIPQKLETGISVSRTKPLLSGNSKGNTIGSWLTDLSGGNFILEIIQNTLPKMINSYFSITLAEISSDFLFEQKNAISTQSSFFAWKELLDPSAVTIMANNYNLTTGSGSLPTPLSDPISTFSPAEFQLSVDDSNNALVAWIFPDTKYLIQSSKYSTATGNWQQTPGVIYEAPLGSTLKNLRLSMNPSGESVVAWIENNTTAQIQFNTAPLPATKLNATRAWNRFPFQTEYSHVLRWKPSTTVGIVSYKIFADGALLATVPSAQHTYTAHNCSKTTPVLYAVIAVSSTGQESAATTLLFP